MISQQDAENILQSAIKEKRTHQDYEHVVTYSELMRKLITGKDVESLLRRFNLRETDEMFRQRVILSQITTSSVCGSLMTPAQKIPRVNPIVDSIKIKQGNLSDQSSDESVKLIREKLSEYYGGSGIDEFIEKRVIPLMYIDPNSFIITLFDSFDNRYETARPYPVLIPSSQAVDYSVKNNELEWLIVKGDCQYLTSARMLNGSSTDVRNSRVKSMKGNSYHIYAKDVIIEYKQIDSEYHNGSESTFSEIVPEQYRQNGIAQRLYKTGRKEVYLVSYYEPKAGVIQAVRIGCMHDERTDGRTFVSPIHPAIPHLMKSIKTVSEMDISISLHVFLQKLSYQPKCLGESNTVTCNRGYTPQGTKCNSCGGSGYQVATTGQDAIYLALPDDVNEAFQLDKLTTYVHVPIEIVKFLDEFCDKLERKCVKAVYNSELFSTDSISTTATEKNIDMQSVYDSLYPISTTLARIRKEVTVCIAGLIDVKNVEVQYQFPRDLKMKSPGDLFAELKTASDSGAPQYVKQEISNDIAAIYFIDRPDEKKKLEVRQRFNPFDGKTETEIAASIGAGIVTERTKILWSESATIFSELENQFPKQSGAWFYDLAYERQKELIDVKVQEIASKIRNENPVSIQFSQSGIPEGAEEQGGVSRETENNSILDGQIELRSSVGGVSAILSIQESVSKGVTDYDSGVSMLMSIFGFEKDEAMEMLGSPKSSAEIIAEETEAANNG